MSNDEDLTYSDLKLSDVKFDQDEQEDYLIMPSNIYENEKKKLTIKP